MPKLTKRMRVIRDKIDAAKHYEIEEACILLKNLSTTRFVESVDVAINLGIDSRKSDQSVRGATILPYGIGRHVCVAVFTQGKNVEIAKSAGADLVGMDDLSEQIKKGKFNFDVIIASPDAMYIVSQLGYILGPRGLMPNPKIGTVTSNLSEAIKNVKSGQIRYRNDKNGIVHTTIGTVKFEVHELKENLEALLLDLKKVKPINTKGAYIKKISLSTTMGISIKINQNSLSLALT
ncbi:50S ribosomal protein L1 [Candidatus Curculioniphilus buchneri]|uniref:50S ribosomal protein L1 n=1 Tax=Candidatus Curculioniphilus buchneri TaxID=690594 RepID=UPI00376EB5BA